MTVRLGCIFFVGVVATAPPIRASPAVRLGVVINPCIGVCPSSPGFFALPQGAVVPLSVAAIDAGGGIDTTYIGTVTFSSTDALATVPQTYTFTAIDGGGHVFLASTAFRTLGLQTISATDTVSGITGSASVTIVAAAASVSVTTRAGSVIFVAALALIGSWLIRGAGA